MDIYAERMIAACRSLQAIKRDLQRNAVLNDVQKRNEEVLLGSSVEKEREMARGKHDHGEEKGERRERGRGG